MSHVRYYDSISAHRKVFNPKCPSFIKDTYNRMFSNGHLTSDFKTYLYGYLAGGIAGFIIYHFFWR